MWISCSKLTRLPRKKCCDMWWFISDTPHMALFLKSSLHDVLIPWINLLVFLMSFHYVEVYVSSAPPHCNVLVFAITVAERPTRVIPLITVILYWHKDQFMNRVFRLLRGNCLLCNVIGKADSELTLRLIASASTAYVNMWSCHFKNSTCEVVSDRVTFHYCVILTKRHLIHFLRETYRICYWYYCFLQILFVSL